MSAAAWLPSEIVLVILFVLFVKRLCCAAHPIFARHPLAGNFAMTIKKGGAYLEMWLNHPAPFGRTPPMEGNFLFLLLFIVFF
jgi:hypothetical protein